LPIATLYQEMLLGIAVAYINCSFDWEKLPSKLGFNDFPLLK